MRFANQVLTPTLTHNVNESSSHRQRVQHGLRHLEAKTLHVLARVENVACDMTDLQPFEDQVKSISRAGCMGSVVSNTYQTSFSWVLCAGKECCVEGEVQSSVARSQVTAPITKFSDWHGCMLPLISITCCVCPYVGLFDRLLAITMHILVYV
jgi:hypothetical protein